MKLRDWVAFTIGGYLGKKLVMGAVKRVLPK